MDEKAPVSKLRANLSPAAEHRRQMRWQVWVPLIASIVVILALVSLTVIGAMGGSSQIARWANLSAVWIIAPVMLVGFLFLVITAACVYGMSKLLKRMPDWMLRVQLWMEHLALTVRRAADAATQPVMATSGLKARALALWRKITGKSARRPQAGLG
jgi:hypothetical protein